MRFGRRRLGSGACLAVFELLGALPPRTSGRSASPFPAPSPPWALGILAPHASLVAAPASRAVLMLRRPVCHGRRRSPLRIRHGHRHAYRGGPSRQHFPHPLTSQPREQTNAHIDDDAPASADAMVTTSTVQLPPAGAFLRFSGARPCANFFSPCCGPCATPGGQLNDSAIRRPHACLCAAAPGRTAKLTCPPVLSSGTGLISTCTVSI